MLVDKIYSFSFTTFFLHFFAICVYVRLNSKAFQQYVLNVKGKENILQKEEEKRDDRIKIIQKVDLTTKGHSERRYDKKRYLSETRKRRE